ncbi:unnamed protein product [Diatraea saccharalis]|uniref:Uncharacterized protein n=1 Tax=Diatraea saccharalis TaxID=40085 RepID=A0A9P0C1M7_9NEOP|nr:unnamed protein product [Diatraea saccharalis]
MAKFQFTVVSFNIFRIIRSINDVLEQIEFTFSNVYMLVTSAHSVPRMLSHLIWCLCQIMWLIEIVEPCHRTKLEIDRTKLLISKLSTVMKGQPALVELEKLAQHIEMNAVGYSPMGVCNLSRSLIATVR